MAVKTRVHPGVVIAVIAGLLLAVGVFGPMGQPLLQSLQGRVIRAEVETDHGEFDVVLLAVSTLTGTREYVNGRKYSQSFGYDIVMERGETLTVFLTAGAVIERTGKRTLTCRLRENGKEVDKHSVVVRAGQPGEPCGCSMTFSY